MFMFIAPGPLELLMLACILLVPLMLIAVSAFLRRNSSEQSLPAEEDSFWSDWGEDDSYR